MADNINNYCACTGEDAQYIVLLNQQGAQGLQGEQGEQGYSPEVNFIVNDGTIQVTSVNQNNTTTSPNLYDYLAKKDLSNTTIATDYMKVDGSNSADTIELNTGLTLRHNDNIAYIENNKNINAAIYIGSHVYVQSNGIHTSSTSLVVQSGLSGLEINNSASGVLLRDKQGNNTLRLSQNSNSLSCQSDDFNIYTYSHKLYYYNQNKAFSSINSEVATIGDLSDFVSSDTLSTTLADYLKSTDAATTYLKADGSNAASTISLNGWQIGSEYLNKSNTQISDISLYSSTDSGCNATIGVYGNNHYAGLVLGDFLINSYTSNNTSGAANTTYIASTNPILLQNNTNYKAYYHGTSDSNELATKGDIPTVNNPTITITQGGTTKGSFTLNQDNDSTIDIESSDLSNYVTLDSQQEISGAKTFDSNLTVGNGGNLILNNTGDTDHIWITNDGNVSTTDNTDTETTTTVMNHLTYLSTGTGTEVLHDIDNMSLPIALYNTSNAKVAEVTTDGNGHLQIDTDDLQVTGSVSTDQLLSNDSVSYLTINTDKVLLGNGALELDLFGNATRPKYNNNDLALYSDVTAATSGLKPTDVTTLYNSVGNVAISTSTALITIGQTYLDTTVILGSNNALRVARYNDSDGTYTYSNVLDEGNIASNSTITALQNTITELTNRIAALEANINGGNA